MREGKKEGRKNGNQEGFTLAHTLRVQSFIATSVKKQRAMNAGSLSTSSLLFSSRSQLMEWLPTVKESSQLIYTNPGNLSQAGSEACLSRVDRSRQVDSQY